MRRVMPPATPPSAVISVRSVLTRPHCSGPRVTAVTPAAARICSSAAGDSDASISRDAGGAPASPGG